MGRFPTDASMPSRLDFVKPWDDLTDQEKATETRGMEVYAGMVDAMDYHYGRVIDYLRDIGDVGKFSDCFLVRQWR